MIILTKQLLDEHFSIEKVQLHHHVPEQMRQIVNFDADLIVGTASADVTSILDLALFSKTSFALYHPEITKLMLVAPQFKQAKYQHMRKMLYLSNHDLKHYASEIAALSNEFIILFDGNYQQAYEQLTFDIREAEIDFSLER